jgi:hypothetical protein
LKAARWLVMIGSLLVLFGAILHIYGYTFAMPRVAATNAGPEILNVFKALWWSFSVTGIVLCPVIVWASRLPTGRGLVLLCTVIPAAISVLMFCFLGVFIGSIIFSTATLLLLVGGLMLPSGEAPQRRCGNNSEKCPDCCHPECTWLESGRRN